MIRKMICGAGALGASLFAATTAFAQAAPIKAPTAEQMATMVNKGDNTWMLMSSVLVLLMSIPALALFYGGLVRTKNMLSVLMQVFMIVSVAALVWVCWGYSMAFTGGSPFVGGFSKAFLMGVSASTYAATFSNNVYLPEYTYVIFQMTFACITPALIVGAFAERVKFTPLIIFTVLWLTFIYFPMAHMVWYFAGPDFLSANTSDAGYLYGLGALDFAGGTVVHINAGIAGLVGCLVIGKRVGFGKEAALADHDHDRRLAAVGWLVRLQRRFEPGSQWSGLARLYQHLRRHRRCRCQLVAGGTGQAWQALDAGRCFGCCGRSGGHYAGLGLCRSDDLDRAGPGGFADLLLLRLDREEQAQV